MGAVGVRRAPESRGEWKTGAVVIWIVARILVLFGSLMLGAKVAHGVYG